MILTCPSCGTQYAVKDGAIPEGGRKVRVSRTHRPELERRLGAIATRAQQLFDEMDFSFLFDPTRKLFSIGYRTAERITEAFIRFWEAHWPLMRVMELTSAEGDERFRSTRTSLLSGVLAVVLAAGLASSAPAARRAPTRCIRVTGCCRRIRSWRGAARRPGSSSSALPPT